MAELMLGQPLFPGESGIDQLVEIIKVLGTPTRDQIKTMNPNVSIGRCCSVLSAIGCGGDIIGLGQEHWATLTCTVHGAQVPSDQAPPVHQSLPAAYPSGRDRLDQPLARVHPHRSFDVSHYPLRPYRSRAQQRKEVDADNVAPPKLWSTSSSTSSVSKARGCLTGETCPLCLTGHAKVSYSRAEFDSRIRRDPNKILTLAELSTRPDLIRQLVPPHTEDELRSRGIDIDDFTPIPLEQMRISLDVSIVCHWNSLLFR